MEQSQRTQTQEVTSVAAPEKVVTKTTTVTPPAVKTEHPQKVFQKKKVIFRTYQIIWFVLAIVETLLGFRMTLKALGANAASGFTSLIYALSDPLALPFSGILNLTVTNNSVFEWSTIVAAIVYAIIAYALVHVLQLMKPVTPTEVSETVDNT